MSEYAAFTKEDVAAITGVVRRRVTAQRLRSRRALFDLGFWIEDTRKIRAARKLAAGGES